MSKIHLKSNVNLQILDRHHAWRSLDPTLDISSHFVKKKRKHFASYFLLFHLFYLFIKTFSSDTEGFD